LHIPSQIGRIRSDCGTIFRGGSESWCWAYGRAINKTIKGVALKSRDNSGLPEAIIVTGQFVGDRVMEGNGTRGNRGGVKRGGLKRFVEEIEEVGGGMMGEEGGGGVGFEGGGDAI
jgi:hypothetical protein